MTDDTLRKECEELLYAFDDCIVSDENISTLLAFARAQQAKGIRIVEREMRQSGNTKLAGWIVWCEAQATARGNQT